MITLDMVRFGYDSGLIRLIPSPNDDGIACSIGDGWFYFGGHTAEEYSIVESYKRDIPVEDIVKDIYGVLEQFQTELEDEYLYYEYYLREKIHDPEISRNPDVKAELQIVNSFVSEDLASIYSVSLAHGFFVDVKVFDKSGLIYVMENHNGSTVYGFAGPEVPISNYNYDEASIIKFVKDFHEKEKVQHKDFLSNIIKAASTRAAEPQPSNRTALKRLDFAQNLNISSNSKSIQFVEKEAWPNSEPFTGGCDMYPIYMIKDGVEHFMFNRRSDESAYESERDKACKAQLLANGGMFFRFYGPVDTPYEYLRYVIERHHSFEKFSHKEVEWFDDGKFCDFHGNLKEVSAAFMYRIYDKELAANIEKVVGLIHHKKYNEALDVLNEGLNGENVKRSSSLASKIESASTRVGVPHSADKTPVKESGPER